MPGKFAPVPKLEFFDSNGNPLVGGKLYTYLAGSTTLATTYQDSALATPNTNPIVLNARGEPPADVWLTSGVTYKFVLKDSNDVQIWSVDNVTGVNDVTGAVDEWQASGLTPTYIGATSFSVPGDQTQTLTIGRRCKFTVTAGTVYGRIQSSSFGAGITTVVMVLDSGALDNGLSAVSIGILRAVNSSIPFVRAVADSGLSFEGSIARNSVLTPAQITANTNDYAPATVAGQTFLQSNVLRLSTDASRNVTGLTGGAAGRELRLCNVGSFPIVFTREDAASTAANRFAFDADLTIQPNQSVYLWYDATSSRWRLGRCSNGEFRSVQVFTANGTYTAPAGLKRAKVTVVGGGGGGGGSPNTGAGQGAAAGGGGAGGYAIKTVSAATIGATQTVTVGAAGSGGGGGTTNGGSAGGTSSFGAICSATGGNGGGPGSISNNSGPDGSGGGGSGGTGTGGDINGQGGPGSYGTRNISDNVAYGGVGGSSILGGGGYRQSGGGGGSGQTPSQGYGGGGSGGSTGGATSGGAGGNGTAGVVIVEEFF